MRYIVGLCMAFALFSAVIASWITHVVWWIGLAMNGELDTGGEIVLAILGTIIPFIGMIHGFMIWF